MLTFFAGASYGQFGVRAGGNLASLKIKVDFLGTSLSVNTDDKLGGHIGVYYKEKIGEKFTLRPNLIFTTAGGKATDETTGESSNLNATYLGIPVDFLYSSPVGENSSFALLGGPFVGYLLSSSADEGGEDDAFKSLDYGLNFGVQFQANKIGVGLTYGLGLANIVPETEANILFADASASTRIISLFLTYDI